MVVKRFSDARFEARKIWLVIFENEEERDDMS